MAANTVLITGAFGQVGKRCTEILLSRGRTVIAVDLRNADAVREVVAEHPPGAIVHLAAIYSPPSYRNPRFARKVNVEGTRNVVEAAKALGQPPLILKASSAAVYG